LAVFSRKHAVSLKRGKVDQSGYEKVAYMRFQLLPKATIMDVLERPLDTVAKYMHLSQPTIKI